MRGAGHHSYFAHLQVAVSEEGKCRFSSYINNVAEEEGALVSQLERLLDKWRAERSKLHLARESCKVADKHE